jgi:hypothetical protein
MNDHGKSDVPVVPANPPNKAATAVAEVGEGRGAAKGNRAAYHVLDAGPDQACHRGWTVCVKWHEGIRMRGSRRCCITLT